MAYINKAKSGEILDVYVKERNREGILCILVPRKVEECRMHCYKKRKSERSGEPSPCKFQMEIKTSIDDMYFLD